MEKTEKSMRADDSQRLQEIDIIKGIAMLAVILVHIPSEYRFINTGISFHIAAFFATSGILLSRNEKLSVNKEAMMRDGKTIIWPYLLLSLLNILLGLFKDVLRNDLATTNVIYNIFSVINFSGMGTLWFFPVFFLSKIQYRYLKTNVRGKYFWPIYLVGGVIIARILTVLNISNVCEEISLCSYVVEIVLLFVKSLIGVGYMGFGSTVYRLVLAKINRNFVAQVLALLAGLVMMIFNIILFPYYGRSDLHYARIENSMGYIVCSLLGVFSVILLASVLKNIPPLNKILSFLGRHSFVIMVTHLDFGVVAICVSIALAFSENNMIVGLSAFVLVVLVESIIAIFYDKFKIIRGIFDFDIAKNLRMTICQKHIKKG